MSVADIVAEARRQFPVTRKWIYFNHASEAPLSYPVVRAVAEYSRQRLWVEPPQAARRDAAVRRAREGFARLIGAQPDEIALTAHTSEGTNAVAASLPLSEGDNVVVAKGDFPASLFPWLRRAEDGVELRFVDGREHNRLQDFLEKINARTKAVVCSHVHFLTGERLDLARLGEYCRERGIILIVDGMQSAGAVGIDVKRWGVSCLAVGGHKWLLAPYGVGCLYVDRALAERLRPRYVSYHGVATDPVKSVTELQLLTGTRRFETGSLAFDAVFGLAAALEWLNRMGPQFVEQRVLALSGALAASLRRMGFPVATPEAPAERAGIVSFAPRDPKAAVAILAQAGVIGVHRDPFVRLSPHFYNTEVEVEKTLAVCRDMIR